MEIPAGFGLITFGMIGTGDTDEMVSVLGVQLSGDPSEADLTNAFDEYTTAVAPIVSNTILRTVVRCYVSPDDTGEIVEHVWADDSFGSSAGDVLPNNSAYILKKHTGFGGRANRGRLFLPGVLVGNTEDSGNVSAATIASTNTALADWLTGFPFGNIDGLALLHGDGSLISPRAISSLTLSRRLGTMHHRYNN